MALAILAGENSSAMIPVSPTCSAGPPEPRKHATGLPMAIASRVTSDAGSSHEDTSSKSMDR